MMALRPWLGSVTILALRPPMIRETPYVKEKSRYRLTKMKLK
jgi:hypothetical protein